MTLRQGLVSFVILLGCQTKQIPKPEPATTTETPEVSEIRGATIPLPSSSLIAVFGKGVTALSPSGILSWSYTLPGNDGLTTKPVVAPNSYVYLRGARTVYALGPEGRQLWAAEIEAGKGKYRSLIVLTDSSVAAVISDSDVVCLNTIGTVRWTHQLPGGATLVGEPTSAPNGFLLLRTRDRIYALNSDGQLQWSTVLPPA